MWHNWSMIHITVLLNEAIGFLQVQAGEWYIDATLGSGGHAKEILRRGGNVLGIDQDVKAIKRIQDAGFRIQEDNFRVENGNFANLKEIAEKNGLEEVAGVLFDLGVSSEQLADSEAGISFLLDSLLDMRLSPDLGVSAADLVNALTEKELARMFREYGDEPQAGKIARAIVERRREKRFERTGELVVLVESIKARPRSEFFARPGLTKLHPATKVFQALRIAVNGELDNLVKALPQAVGLLKPGGRLVVISFHSGEDRIVKSFLKRYNPNIRMKSNAPNTDPNMALKIVTKKPAVPNDEEVKNNPRARSAKMRVGERV